MKHWLSKNWFKACILAMAFIVVFSVAYYYLIFLPQKEQTRIELKEQERLIKEQERLAQEIQDKKEYIAERKGECYDIYLQEKKNWNNIKDFRYSEVRDVCLVKYKSDKPAKSEKECREASINIDLPGTELSDWEIYDLYYLDCVKNWFSKEF
jgi:hypothetical protein